jgi:ribosomal protein S18 acetylase RimI-like enzyme
MEIKFSSEEKFIKDAATRRKKHYVNVNAFIGDKNVAHATFEYFTETDNGEDTIICENGLCEAYMSILYVKKEYRGQGIGTYLLHHCIKMCDDLCLRSCVVLAPDNIRAKTWYKSIGNEISDDINWSHIDQGYGVFRVFL